MFLDNQLIQANMFNMACDRMVVSEGSLQEQSNYLKTGKGEAERNSTGLNIKKLLQWVYLLSPCFISWSVKA